MSADVEPAPLSRESAQALTEQIRQVLHTGHKLLLAAHVGEAHVALGYERSEAGWVLYCETEFADARSLRIDPQSRREVAAPMREAGMSDRAIGAALGVGKTTVLRDLGATGPDGPVARPPVVRSLDGSRRSPVATAASTSPRGHEVSPGGRPAMTDAEREAVLDAHAPGQDYALTRWRAAFGVALRHAAEVLQYDAGDVADQADAQLMRAYEGLIRSLNDHHAAATAVPRLRAVGGQKGTR